MATLADYPDDWEDVFVSNPNFSVVEYMRRMSEYQRLLKERQDAADASGMGEGRDTHGNVQWGGGPFSKTEYETGDLDIVADKDLPAGVTQDAAGNRFRMDDLGNKISMGARWPGLQIARQIPNIVNFIPGYNVVKAINDSINKNKNQTVAASTDDTGTTNTNTPSYDVAAGYESYDDAMKLAAKRTALAGGVPWGSDYANRIGALSTQNNSWNNIAPSIHANLTGRPDFSNIATDPTIVNANTGSVWGDYMDEAAGGGGIIEAMIAAGADVDDPFGDPTGFM